MGNFALKSINFSFNTLINNICLGFSALHSYFSGLCYLLFSISVVLNWGCESEVPVAKDFVTLRKREPLSETYGVQYFYSEGSIVKAKMKAPYVSEIFVGLTDETFTKATKGIEIEFLNDSGSVESKLKANQAEFYPRRGYAVATGEVVVVNEKGEKLETQTLYWHQTTNTLSTRNFVRITTDKEILMGDSLTADAGFKHYKIYKIRGILTLQE